MTVEEDYQRWLNGVPLETFDHKQIPLTESTALSRQQLLSSAAYSDVTLRCDGRSIKCHRFVLSEYSPVFSAMFQSGFKEGRAGNPVVLKSVSFKVLQKAIHILYGGSIDISGQDVMMLLEFADMYDIKPLRKLCGKMMFKHITPTVAMTVWKYAKMYQVNDITSKCQQYCVGKYNDKKVQPHIKTLSGFLESEPDLIIPLLSDCKLKVSTENEVFSAILDWLMFDQEKRAVHLKEILEKCVRLETMDKTFVRFYINHKRLNTQSASLISQVLAYDKIAGTILKPREHTKFRDSLTMHIHHPESEEIAEESCLWGDSKEKRLHFFNLKLIPFPFGEICRTFEFDNYTHVANLGANGGLSCTADNNHWKRNIVKHHVDVLNYHLIQLSDEELLYVTTENGLTIKKIHNNSRAHTEYKHCTPHLKVSATDLQLTAVFGNHLFMFVPGENKVHVFETLHGHFVKSMTAPAFSNDNKCFCIASKKNIACLVGKKLIYIIHLDRLLHQTPAADTDCEPPDAKRLKEEDGDQSATSVRCDAIKRVKTPVAGVGRHTAEAIIYGTNLCIAEKNVDQNDEIVLRLTDLNSLIVQQDARIRWRREAITLGSVSRKIARAGCKVQFFNTRHSNPFSRDN